MGRLDEQLKVSHKRIRTAVAASNTTITDVVGIGPILACYLVGFTGDIGHFDSRDRYAAYNGTAPVERPDGLRPQGGRGQDEERRHPIAQAASLQHRLPMPRRGPAQTM